MDLQAVPSTPSLRRASPVLPAGLLLLLAAVALAAEPPPVETWTTTWNGPGNHDDETTLVVFGADGEVYAAGTTYTPGVGAEQENIFLRRYEPDGSLAWSIFHGGAGYDAPFRLLRLASGDLALVGIVTTGGLREVATRVYDTDGGLVWSVTSPVIGAMDLERYPPSCAEDRDGNLLVAMTSADDYEVRKYGPAGSLLWVRSYDGPTGGLDQCGGVAADAAGAVYVTGIVTASTGFHLTAVTVKYDAAGDFQWESTENGDFNSFFPYTAVAVAPDGDVVVAADPESVCGTFQVRTWRLDSDTGGQRWLRSFPPEPCQSFEPVDMAVASDGGVVVTGFGSLGPLDISFLTLRYAPDGTLSWHREFDGGNGGTARPYALALDVAGSAYVVGFGTFGVQNRDHAAVKYTAAGDVAWNLFWVGAADRNDWARAVAVSPRGDVAIAGQTYDPASPYDATLLRFAQVRPTAVPPLVASTGPELRIAPNPASSGTVFSFRSAQSGPVQLEIYDLRGRRVAVMHDGSVAGSVGGLAWQGRDAQGRSLPSGTYLARLVARDGVATAVLRLVR